MNLCYMNVGLRNHTIVIYSALLPLCEEIPRSPGYSPYKGPVIGCSCESVEVLGIDIFSARG